MGIRWQYIRSAAAELRRAYAAELGLARAPLALDLEELADRLYLLTVCDDPDLEWGINGELNPQIGSIRLQPRLAPARRRFVIAHELGHFVLEGGASILFEDDDSTLDERAGGDLGRDADLQEAYNTRERREQEANLFALELLIPALDLWQAVQQPNWSFEQLAQRFRVSAEALRAQLINVCCLEPVVAARAQRPSGVVQPPDPSQQAAVEAQLPTLVVAGPGTGKTRTIVAKYVALVAAGADPASILALTFSNKAAEEMRERITAALDHERSDLAGRVEISTFHAWGLNFLKQYGHAVGLPLDLQLRTTGDLYMLLRRRLADLPLEQYKDLRDPGQYLGQLIKAISRAKDELCDPETYARLAEVEGQRIVVEAERQHGTKATKTALQAREKAQRNANRLTELAQIYARYEQILREEHVLDYGDLIVQSVRALRVPEVAAVVHARYQYILVDEFQDINYASGELVRLLDGGRGRVWAVGDPWQSIYRFRGASPANLQAFAEVYPNGAIHDLQTNYRSVQAILDASHALMEPDPLFDVRQGLVAQRTPAALGRAVVERVAADPEGEAAAIAHDILRHVRPAYRLPHCARSAPCQRTGVRRLPQGRPRRRRSFRDIAVLCRTHAQATQIIAALQAHGIPVDQAGQLFDVPEVKDMLALVASVRVSKSVGLLRVLTAPDHALNDNDMTTLVRLAHQQRLALPRAVRNAQIVAQLSPEGQERLQTLRRLLVDLGRKGDAWQVIAHALFEHSNATRRVILQAAAGSFAARRALAALGQLLVLARNFVRQAPPRERGPKAFVAYVRLLIEAGERIPVAVPAEQADLVRVMTVHAAKGLEFPVVYVPGLHDGVYPMDSPSDSVPLLPTMIHGTLPDDVQEERYLLYVAMTRARDRLVLSRAVKRNHKQAERSSLLPSIPDGVPTPWPIIEAVAASPCPSPRQEVRLRQAPVTRRPISASSIETYERCPRQYLYQYGYQLFDDVSPYLRMHQTIRDLVQQLTQRAREGTLPPDMAALRQEAWRIFLVHEMADVLYRDDYFHEVLRHITKVWEDLRTGIYTPDAVNQRYVVRRPEGEIEVRVDRVEQGPNGPRLIRTRSGREGSRDHLSTQIMLYLLAARQEYETSSEVELYYTATGVSRQVKPTPKVLVDHTTKIDDLLTNIRHGFWRPKLGPQCGTCPFNLICPA